MYLNQLTIIGFTGQDAEFHFTSNGTPRDNRFGRNQRILEKCRR